MRIAEITRKTKETDIAVTINADGSGKADILTGIGFFDHMLTAFAVHSGFDLFVRCNGDLEVDGHHTVEDVGIVFGQAFAQAIGDKKGIARYGNFAVPMDESLASCSMDVGGRAYLVFNADFQGESIGDMNTQLVREFFQAFASNACVTLHLNLIYGENDHHKCEALFKSFAHTVKSAVKKDGKDEVLSSKGTLE
ncbi:MAG: imidazoleglycerol-phosphate dehydratase HisB [Clostridiales Family XIII bacterium]|jgi:imidazoleglycerol-phosphate dehydratase|nr:imidazoleglycerol-phosphate dehydratase HisB [Clostridiales Family XIII bacterium]